MLLFVGLGNPGPEYVATRHNIGFMALQAIADFWGIKPWRRRFHGVFVEGLIQNERVGLLLPETFMNDSGRSVVEAARSFGLDLFQIVIFHDDIELSPGDIRVKVGGGMAGHQGLRSITGLSGTADYRRVRLGIGRPPDNVSVHDYVLHSFSKHEWPLAQAMCHAVARNAPSLFRNDDMFFEKNIEQELLSDGFKISKKRPKK